MKLNHIAKILITIIGFVTLGNSLVEPNFVEIYGTSDCYLGFKRNAIQIWLQAIKAGDEFLEFYPHNQTTPLLRMENNKFLLEVNPTGQKTENYYSTRFHSLLDSYGTGINQKNVLIETDVSSTLQNAHTHALASILNVRGGNSTNEHAAIVGFTYSYGDGTTGLWGEDLHIQKMLGQSDGAIVGLEVGVHNRNVRGISKNFGIHVWSGDQGEAINTKRSGDAIHIDGGAGWANALKYLDLDGTTVLFRVDSIGKVLSGNVNGGNVVLNPEDGGFDVASGNDSTCYIDFKGKYNLQSDYRGRISFKDKTDNTGGFSFEGVGNMFRVGIGSRPDPNTIYGLTIVTNKKGISSGWNTYVLTLNQMSDVQPITSALDKITKLKAISYVPNGNGYKDREIGIADNEVKTEFPDLINTYENGNTIDYGRLTVLLMVALQEQQKEIKQLQKRITDIENNKVKANTY